MLLLVLIGLKYTGIKHSFYISHDELGYKKGFNRFVESGWLCFELELIWMIYNVITNILSLPFKFKKGPIKFENYILF